MTKLEQAARQALETLERASDAGYSVECDETITALREALEQAAPRAAPGEPFDECFPGEPRVAVPQGLIGAACFAIRNKRDGGKVLEQLRRYSVGDLSQPLAPQPAPAPLSDAIKHYLKAQDALDNREYAGINAESYEKLIRCRNASRKDLDAALAAQGDTP